MMYVRKQILPLRHSLFLYDFLSLINTLSGSIGYRDVQGEQNESLRGPEGTYDMSVLTTLFF